MREAWELGYRPVSDFSVGDIVDGCVVHKHREFAVFIDIGSPRNARLDAPYRIARSLKMGEKLLGLRVIEADEESDRLSVAFDDLEHHVRGRQTPLGNFRVGAIVSGRVVARLWSVGVFIDIGTTKDALLAAERWMAMKLECNEVLEGLRVIKVDPEKGHLGVAYDCLAWHVRDRFRPLGDFAVGDAVTGRVAAKRRGRGVLIDIGAERKARLLAPFETAMKLGLDDVISGLRVESVDDERGEVCVVCRDLERHVTRHHRSISELSVGDVVDGWVAYKLWDVGAYVEIGFRRKALLKAPCGMAMKLERFEPLQGLRVESLDGGKVVVAYDGLEARVKERYRPITDFSVGDVVEGSVAFIRRGVGAFLDVGAQGTARLAAPYRLAVKLRPGDRLDGLRVELADQKTGELVVKLDGLKAFLSDRL